MGCVESDATSSPVTANTQRPLRNRRVPQLKKPHVQPYISRRATKYTPQDIKIVTDEDRHAGATTAYACPICFLYFNKILACSQCKNCICFDCFTQYQTKWKKDMKCSFCSSTNSVFVDYEQEAHSYFDSSNNGFLSKQERKKIDQQIFNRPTNSSLAEGRQPLHQIGQQNGIVNDN